MILYICEKPSQGRDLARNLNLSGNSKSDYIGNKKIMVTWGIGHMLQQANHDDYDPKFSNWKNSFDDLPFVPESNNWKMLKNPKTIKQLNVVRGLIRIAKEVVIATDGDREGEVIGRELLEFYQYQGVVNRLWLTALDDSSIQKSLQNIKKGSETESLYSAGLARSRADWMVGLNVTRIISVKAQMQGQQGVFSVGRVQTPTLAIVVNRDQEIESFVSKDYFELNGVFSGVEAKWQCFLSDFIESQNHDDGFFDNENRCIDLKYAQKIADKVENDGNGKVIKFETKRKQVTPPLLYSLSKMQQEASKKFNFGAKQVLDLLQSLYEKHKATTYPRSDCQYLPEDQLGEAENILKTLVSIDKNIKVLANQADLSVKSKVWNNKKLSAHHAIIPTANTNIFIDNMSSDEFKIYDLIRRSYIAQFYPPYQYDQTSIVINANDEIFTTSINVDVNFGWKPVISNDVESKQNTVPKFKQNQVLVVDSIDVKEKQTKPPVSYTEGTLIAAMSKAHQFVTDSNLKKILKGNEGIGTEATRATMIEKLIKRDFVKKSKKQLISTSKGRSLIDIVPAELKDPGMTAILESSLDKIASGELSLDKYMDWQIDWLDKLCSNIKNNPLNIKSNAKTYPCPECDKDMFLRNGKKGKFWTCSGYPECKTTAQNQNGKPLFEDNMPDCPKCAKKLRKVKGKKGYFLACRGYFDKPKCDFITKDAR